MADPARARRLAKRIMTIVAGELAHQIKDPRLAMVTITATVVTPDLRDATVYYTVYGDDVERIETAAALASATGVVRSAVGRETGIKFTPTVTFVVDTVGEQSRHIETLLSKAKVSDAAIAAQSVGAGFAGEADPYKQPRESDELEAELEEDGA